RRLSISFRHQNNIFNQDTHQTTYQPLQTKKEKSIKKIFEPIKPLASKMANSKLFGTSPTSFVTSMEPKQCPLIPKPHPLFPRPKPKPKPKPELSTSGAVGLKPKQCPPKIPQKPQPPKPRPNPKPMLSISFVLSPRPNQCGPPPPGKPHPLPVRPKPSN
ncbi:hypothetical protein F4808DRAFT_194492, partial [Astrocystis sublimbata]